MALVERSSFEDVGRVIFSFLFRRQLVIGIKFSLIYKKKMAEVFFIKLCVSNIFHTAVVSISLLVGAPLYIFSKMPSVIFESECRCYSTKIFVWVLEE